MQTNFSFTSNYFCGEKENKEEEGKKHISFNDDLNTEKSRKAYRI